MTAQPEMVSDDARFAYWLAHRRKQRRRAAASSPCVWCRLSFPRFWNDPRGRHEHFANGVRVECVETAS